jgi:hypothetical protein
VADVFRRAQSIDKEVLRKALADTNLDSICGHVKFKEKNIAVMPSGLIQWVKGSQYPFDCRIVANGNHKVIKTQSKLLTLQEIRG